MLKVLKASAGSGKTFRLTLEYLKICFNNSHDSRYFSHILAMTFTNDATAEMKTRIITVLKDLAEGSAEKEIVDEIKTSCQLDEKQIEAHAKQILEQILLQYNTFSIITLDSFFQKIMGVFYRELEIPGNFELELDGKKALGEALQLFLDDLEKGNTVYRGLQQIINEKIQAGKSVNFKSDLIAIGMLLLSENIEEKLSQENYDTLQSKYDQLKIYRKQFEEKCIDCCRKFHRVLQKHDIDISDFSGGNKYGIAKYASLCLDTFDEKFIEDPKINKFSEAAESAEHWVSKSSKKAIKAKVMSAENELMPIIQEIVGLYENELSTYNTVRTTLKTYHYYSFLSVYLHYLNEWSEKNQKLLISATKQIIQQVIQFQILPFFYEKIGEKYHHILLDEFQDTSQMQWKNLLPLVENIVSENGSAFVVGDVKQAIYRWRNGDYSTLHIGLENHFAPQGAFENETLGHNWRSHEEIVKFNNDLYTRGPQKLNEHLPAMLEGYKKHIDGELIVSIYKDATQQIDDKIADKRQGGYIEINALMPGKNKDKKEEIKNYQWEILKKQIIACVDRGYDLKDICILCRTNDDAADIGQLLFQWMQNTEDGEKYFLCSSLGALKLQSSISVQAIIAFYKLLLDPQDKVALAEWNQSRSTLNEEDWIPSLKNENPDFFEDILRCQSMSLWEITDYVIDTYGLDKHSTEIPYLQSFQDALLTFSQKIGGQIEAFLDWWDINADKISLDLPQNYNAIRIMTLFKSKGLEFPVVFIPEDWSFLEYKNNSFFWPKPFQIHDLHFNSVPIQKNKGSFMSDFDDELAEESIEMIIDALNMLYVATTRAKKELYIMCYNLSYLKKETKINSTGDLIWSLLNAQEVVSVPVSLENTDDTLEHFCWKQGKPSLNNSEIDHSNRIALKRISAYRSLPQLSDVFLEDKDYNEEITWGKALHEIMENIHDTGDISHAVQQAIEDGLITASDAPKLQTQFEALFQNPSIAALFNQPGKVLDERSILLPQQKQYRPDRVILSDSKNIIIDFKTGKERSKYHKQVQTYKDLLIDMGYSNVNGYLLFLDQPKLVEVRQI